jgi:hypothetical protein
MEMDKIFAIVTEVFLWGSLPLLGSLFYWEDNLPLTNTDHIVLQISLALFLFIWAWFWYSRLQMIQIKRTMKKKE